MRRKSDSRFTWNNVSNSWRGATPRARSTWTRIATVQTRPAGKSTSLFLIFIKVSRGRNAEETKTYRHAFDGVGAQLQPAVPSGEDHQPDAGVLPLFPGPYSAPFVFPCSRGIPAIIDFNWRLLAAHARLSPDSTAKTAVLFGDVNFRQFFGILGPYPNLHSSPAAGYVHDP